MDVNKDYDRDAIKTLYKTRYLEQEFDVMQILAPKPIYKTICMTIARYISNYGYVKPEDIDKEFNSEGLYEFLTVESNCQIQEMEDGNLMFIMPFPIHFNDVFVSTYNNTNTDIIQIYDNTNKAINDVGRLQYTTLEQRKKIIIPIVSKEYDELIREGLNNNKTRDIKEEGNSNE